MYPHLLIQVPKWAGKLRPNWPRRSLSLSGDHVTMCMHYFSVNVMIRASIEFMVFWMFYRSDVTIVNNEHQTVNLENNMAHPAEIFCRICRKYSRFDRSKILSVYILCQINKIFNNPLWPIQYSTLSNGTALWVKIAWWLDIYYWQPDRCFTITMTFRKWRNLLMVQVHQMFLMNHLTSMVEVWMKYVAYSVHPSIYHRSVLHCQEQRREDAPGARPLFLCNCFSHAFHASRFIG